MTNEDLTKLFDLAEELYAEEQSTNPGRILPYAWARDNLRGYFLAISVHSKLSDKVERKLEEII